MYVNWKSESIRRDESYLKQVSIAWIILSNLRISIESGSKLRKQLNLMIKKTLHFIVIKVS